MKKLILILCCAALLLPIQGFSQEEPKSSVRTIKTEAFKTLEIDGVMNVELQQGNEYQLEISGKKEVIESIAVKIEEGSLEINNSWGSPADISTVKVTFPNIEIIEVNGACIVSGDEIIKLEKLHINSAGASDLDLNLEVKILETEIAGASNVKLKGKAIVHEASAVGASNLKASKLETESTEISLVGISSAVINVSDKLDGKIGGMSKLDYIGEPKNVEVNKSGMADLDLGYLEDIEVVTSGDTSKYLIGDSEILIIGEDDLADPMVKVKKSTQKFDGHWGGVELGLNGFLNSNNSFDMPTGYEFLELNQAKSWSVNLNIIEQNINIFKNHFGLTTGLGWQFNNYRFDNNIRLVHDSAQIFGFADTAFNYNKSKLLVNYLTLPIILEYQTNNKSKTNSFHIGAGMIFGLRTGAHTKMVYSEGGKKVKDKVRDNFHTDLFKYEATVRIGWGKINLFANYSLAGLFKDNEGPELYPFTAGITLIGW